MKYESWKLYILLKSMYNNISSIPSPLEDYWGDIVESWDPTNGLPTPADPFRKYFSLATANGWVANHIYYYHNNQWHEYTQKAWDTFLTHMQFPGEPETFEFIYFDDNLQIHNVANLLKHDELQGKGENSHSQIDNHINSHENVHGIANTDVLATQNYVIVQVNGHSNKTDNAHGLPAGCNFVGTNNTQTLSDKTILGSANTIHSLKPGSIEEIQWFQIRGGEFNPYILDAGVDDYIEAYGITQFWGNTARTLEMLVSWDQNQSSSATLNYSISVCSIGEVKTANELTGSINVESGNAGVIQRVIIYDYLTIPSGKKLIRVKISTPSGSQLTVSLHIHALYLSQ